MSSSTDSSATAANVATLRRFVEQVQGNHDLGALPECVSDDIVLPGDVPPAGKQGIEGVRDHLLFMRTKFESRASLEDVVAEGDKVAARVRISGRQIGDMMGVASQGREFAIDEMVIAQFRDGKICEISRVTDLLGLMRQLGGLPGPPPRG